MIKTLKIILILWFFALLFLMIYAGDPENFTVIASSVTSGTTAFLVWLNKGKLIKKFEQWEIPLIYKFVLAGTLGAMWVEFLYWFFERLFGAEGLAVSTNLLYDWIATLPWYILMIYILWFVFKKYSYSVSEILLFGGIYELGADGFLNSILNNTFPQQVLVGVAGFPVFILNYAAIILPASILVNNFQTVRDFWVKRYMYALLPLTGLVPYFLFIKLFF